MQIALEMDVKNLFEIDLSFTLQNLYNESIVFLKDLA